MKAYFYLLLKSILSLTVLLVTFYILEYGFTFDSSDKLSMPFLLSGLTTMMLFKKNLQRYALIFSIVCLTLMILTSIVNWLDLSNIIGSFGFSLLVATIFLYLPQIIKKGHVESF